MEVIKPIGWNRVCNTEILEIVLKNMMEQNNHFSKNEKKQLSSSLLIRKNENYELYGKTGTGIVKTGSTIMGGL